MIAMVVISGLSTAQLLIVCPADKGLRARIDRQGAWRALLSNETSIRGLDTGSKYKLLTTRESATAAPSPRTVCTIRDMIFKARLLVWILGVGMSNEWPTIPNADMWDKRGYDGVLANGMVIGVQSYISGADDKTVSPWGIRLETMVHVTEQGPVELQGYPYDSYLLS